MIFSMSERSTEASKLYDLVARYVSALPEGAQASARTKLDELKSMSAHTDAAYVRVAEAAQQHAATQPAADAALKKAMQTKIFGMSPTTAIVGAVAVGGLAIAATKLMQSRRHNAGEGKWANRISQERAQVTNQNQQR